MLSREIHKEFTTTVVNFSSCQVSSEDDEILKINTIFKKQNDIWK